MQVQLLIANEKHNGRAIPVNVPSFTIGRSEGCNLRSRSPKVSRLHCTITVENNAVMIQDLGGENGTFVNGKRISSILLKDGDKLTVGTHSFVVSIKVGTEKLEVNHDDFFELTPSSMLSTKPVQSGTAHSGNTDKTVVIRENPKKPEQESEIMFEIRLQGQRVSVTKSRLFDLARKGSVLPDDLVTISGTKVFADSIQGIVFGDKSSAPPVPPPVVLPSAPVVNKQVVQSATTSVAPETDPFVFPDLGDVAVEESPFDHFASEPLVRVARRESAFSAIWSALDISFSRVYTMEGNNLVIHSIKALYYVVVVICLLGIFWQTFFIFQKWHGDQNGVLLDILAGQAVGLSAVTFGCVTIIVVVRVLLEMLLVAWFESAKAGQGKENDDTGGINT